MLGLGSRAVAQPQVTVPVTAALPAPAPSTVKTAIAAALAIVAAAVAAAGTLASASLAQLAPVKNAVAGALPTVTAAVSSADAAIPTASFGGMVVGSPVPALVAALQGTIEAVNQQAVSFNIGSYLGRMNANLSNATG